MKLCLRAPHVVLLEKEHIATHTIYDSDHGALGLIWGLCVVLETVLESDLEIVSMRRQKRDMNHRAFDRGYNAGVSGRSAEYCPHVNDEPRLNWISGWREGRSDQWDGLIGVSGVHKLRTL